jgi:uncharacterized protein YqhQ
MPDGRPPEAAHETPEQRAEREWCSPISGFGEQPEKGKGQVHYGGQAVIEGVMMRGPEKVATAVRLPNGEIAIHSEEFMPASRRHRLLRLPVVRGGATLIESLALGIKALNYSASLAMDEGSGGQEEGAAETSGGPASMVEGTEDDAAKGSGEPASMVEETEEARGVAGADEHEHSASPGPRPVAEESGAASDTSEVSGSSDARERSTSPVSSGSSSEIRAVPPPRETSEWKTKAALTGTMVFALALGIVFFFWIPLVLADFIMNTTGTHGGVLFNLIDGVIRVIFFLAYIWGISQWGEMRRVFEYHGAEHKTIFMQEAGEELTPDNARKYATKHPRCGTSFLLIVMVVSILVFMIFGRPHNIAERLFRICLIPVIAGISYEFMKLSAKFSSRRWARALSAPGIWLQNITTKQPSDDQVEVAIASLKAVRIEEAPMEMRPVCEPATASAGGGADVGPPLESADV